MLSEAVSFPRSDDDWLVTVLVGGVLSILGVLVVPTILVDGYLLRVLRAAVEGDPTPPRFDDWLDLLVDGLLVWVVELVYLGVPALVFAGSVVLTAVVGVVTGNTLADPSDVLELGLLGLLPLLSALGLVAVAAYLLPAALANFARTDDVVAAFRLRTIARAAFTADYVVAMVLAIVVSVVLGLLGGLLVLVLVGIFVLFYLRVVAYHLFGQGFARGLGGEARDAGAG